MSDKTNLAEFISGQSDCEKGLPCPVDSSKSYERGYSAQYQLEQNRNNLTERVNGNH